MFVMFGGLIDYIKDFLGNNSQIPSELPPPEQRARQRFKSGLRCFFFAVLLPESNTRSFL